MPEVYRILITPGALADLEAIFDYISHDSLQNAAKMIRTLLDAIDSLDILPRRFDVPRSGSVRGRQVRSMPVRPYLVRYRIDERGRIVRILRVRHGARQKP
ncbi:MAG: Toxin ParE1/3/4 [Phycisphaerales bacterium]|jgi:toxin ParE1/3/4|nr:Toxin ParE1/3/4 [Phycisphaerales bacterium]